MSALPTPLSVASNPEQAFQSAIAAAGLTPPDTVNADGKIHRFSTNGRRGDDSGWYIFHTDGTAAGAFGCWREGFTQIWCAKSDNDMTEAECEAHRQRNKSIQAQRETDLMQRQQSAATDAVKRWQEATNGTQHSYTTAKGVQCYGVKIDSAGALIVPMRDTSGTLQSLQTIAPNGDKRFLSGGRVKGCYHLIGNPSGALIVCEGYATGASIHECTGHAVAVAFNAANLEAVALALRAKYPALKIIVAADDDWKNAKNTGMTSARATALAVGGFLAVPTFPADRPDKATDFNDLHQLSGLDAVKGGIEAAELCSADDWPELQPLIAQIEAQEYPIDALPDAVRCAVQEVAGFVKAPIPLIATSALAALSLAIQALTDVERADKLHGPCGLFLLAIADSGERKSTCDGFFTKAIREYEAEQYEAAKPLITAYQSALTVWEAQRSGLKEKIKSLAKEGKPC